VLQTIEANWIAFALALVIGLLIAWWLFGRGSRTRERSHRPDVLDEGAAPAQRNQSLIDAPSSVRAASYADTGPPIMGGIGEVVAAAAASEVVDAQPPAEKMAEPQPAADPQKGPAQQASEADDLRRIKGIGPKLVVLLHSLGVTRYAQIAAWTDADIDRIDAQMGTFAGRIRRDGWVEQAKLLAMGDAAGFEAKFGKL
jgi:predicted flap endonuclease-1-like 5' DNA nuclease